MERQHFTPTGRQIRRKLTDELVDGEVQRQEIQSATALAQRSALEAVGVEVEEALDPKLGNDARDGHQKFYTRCN